MTNPITTPYEKKWIHAELFLPVSGLSAGDREKLEQVRSILWGLHYDGGAALIIDSVLSSSSTETEDTKEKH